MRLVPLVRVSFLPRFKSRRDYFIAGVKLRLTWVFMNLLLFSRGWLMGCWSSRMMTYLL